MEAPTGRIAQPLGKTAARGLARLLLQTAPEPDVGPLWTEQQLRRAVAYQSERLPEWLVGLVRAADDGGKLDAVVAAVTDELADADEDARTFRPQLIALRRTADFAPLVIALALHAGHHFGAPVAAIWRLYLPVILGFQLLLLAAKGVLRLGPVRMAIGRAVDAIPFVGPMHRARGIRRFLRAFAALRRSDMTVAEAFACAAPAAGTPFLVSGLRRGAEALEKGHALDRALEDTGLFPQGDILYVRELADHGRLDAGLAWLETESSVRAKHATGAVRRALGWAALCVGFLMLAGAALVGALLEHSGVSGYLLDSFVEAM